jgi:hypothetical protein
MLTGGNAAGGSAIGDVTIGFGRQSQAATMMLAMWNTMVVPQNIAAATAEAVMSAAIGASNDSVVTTCHSVATRLT